MTLIKINLIESLVFKPKIINDKPIHVFELHPKVFKDKYVQYPSNEQIGNSNLVDLSKIKIGVYDHSINAQFGETGMHKEGRYKNKISNFIDLNQLLDSQRVKKVKFFNNIYKKSFNNYDFYDS